MSAPVLAVGIGTWAASDDAAGLILAQRLAEASLPGVEVVVSAGAPDALLEAAGRKLVVLFDAVVFGEPPGTVHTFLAEVPASAGPAASHRWSAVEWLRLREAVGAADAPVAVIGIEPAILGPGLELSPAVREAIEPALLQAERIIGTALALA